VTTVSSMTSLVSATGSTSAAAAGGSGISFTWVILLILILFWVFMIVQSRRRKQQQLQQRAGMEPGTRVMLTSGILGTLVERTPDTMVVEVADGVQVTVVPGAIARTLPTLDPTVDVDGDAEDAVPGQPTYTDTTAAGDRDTEDRVLDLDPADGSRSAGREPGPGESAVHEGR
jgi:preprotein translocase subunit YajC